MWMLCKFLSDYNQNTEKSELEDLSSGLSQFLVFPSIKWCEAEHLNYNLRARRNAACMKDKEMEALQLLTSPFLPIDNQEKPLQIADYTVKCMWFLFFSPLKQQVQASPTLERATIANAGRQPLTWIEKQHKPR